MNKKVFPSLSKNILKLIACEETLEEQVEWLVMEGTIASEKIHYYRKWRSFAHHQEGEDAEKNKELFEWSLNWLTQNIVSLQERMEKFKTRIKDKAEKSDTLADPFHEAFHTVKMNPFGLFEVDPTLQKVQKHVKQLKH